MRKEQSNTENNVTAIKSGKFFEKDKKQIKLDNRICNVVSNYNKSDCIEFLKNISLNLSN